MTSSWILSLLLALPGPAPEHAETVSESISSATLAATCEGQWQGTGCRAVWPRSRRELGAGLVVVAYFESAFLARIQRNECRLKIGECDNGFARSYWQTHRHWVPDEMWWHEMIGIDYEAITRSAYMASRALGAGYKKCKSREGALTAYAIGRCKGDVVRAKMRARWWTSMFKRGRAPLPVHLPVSGLDRDVGGLLSAWIADDERPGA